MTAKKTVMQQFLVYWFPVAIYAFLIYMVSAWSQPPLPSIEIPSIDKLFHFIEYLILGYLLRRALTNQANKFWKRYAAIFAVIFTLLYGVSDEIHQSFVPEREAELFDLFSDGLGGVVAQIIYFSTSGRKKSNALSSLYRRCK